MAAILAPKPSPAYTDLEAAHPFELDVKTITDAEKKDLLASSASVTSAETTTNPAISFTPSKTLHIGARGIGIFRFPLPSRELEIAITHPDGSLAYTSTRERVRSGNAVLASPEQGDLVESFYRWGPGRNPELRMLKAPEGSDDVIVKVEGKWTSRGQTFTYSATPVVFEWRYRREKREVGTGEGKKAKKATVLVLEVVGKGKGDVKRVAELIRDEEKRTPGTKSCTAGNGGELQIDELAARRLGIPEELIVSSSIMMLKKEIDRRRTIQIMVIASAVSN